MSDIVTTVSANPVIVLTDAKTYSEFYARMKAETDAHVPDLTTAKGRGEIAALAYKVTRTKTAIDAAGKKLNEEARAKINAVDEQRRKIREELDALAATVRKPLTEWEAKEEERTKAAANIFARLDNYVNIQTRGWSSDHVREHISDLNMIVLDADVLRDDLGEAIAKKETALVALETALAGAVQYEKDQAELARLRAEKEERERAERERIAQEAAERAEREREERERAAAAEWERNAEIARLKAIEQAAEMARDEERRKAKQAEIDRAAAHAAELAKIEAENRRLADAERNRLAAIEKAKREEEARAADRKHRSAIMSAAKSAIMTCGADEETAKKIVLAIVAGEVPNTRISF